MHPLRIVELNLIYPLVGDAKISDPSHCYFAPFVKTCDCKSSVLKEEVFSLVPKVCLSALTAAETAVPSPDGPGFGVVLKSGFSPCSKVLAA